MSSTAKTSIFSPPADMVIFKGITYPQLKELVNSSLLLEDHDKADFVEKYPESMDANLIDAFFNNLFWQELNFIKDEIAEIKKLNTADLAAELPGLQARQQTLEAILENYK